MTTNPNPRHQQDPARHVPEAQTYQERYDAERARHGSSPRKLPERYARTVVNRAGDAIGTCEAGGNADKIVK